MKTRLAGLVALPAIALLALAGCARHHEAQRLAAPGGGIEATLWASELHGTLGYELHVIPAGGTASGGPAIVAFEGVVRNGDDPGVRLQWLQPDLLLVHFTDARNVSQRSASVDVAGRHVRVELEQGPAE